MSERASCSVRTCTMALCYSILKERRSIWEAAYVPRSEELDEYMSILDRIWERLLVQCDDLSVRIIHLRRWWRRRRRSDDNLFLRCARHCRRRRWGLRVRGVYRVPVKILQEKFEFSWLFELIDERAIAVEVELRVTLNAVLVAKVCTLDIKRGFIQQ